MTSVRTVVCIWLVVAFMSTAEASEGDPVALRCWPNSRISVECQWGLSVGVTLGEDDAARDSGLDKQLQLSQTYDHVLYRRPNDPNVNWVSNEEQAEPIPNAIHVQSLAPGAILITVDNAKILAVSTSAKLPPNWEAPLVHVCVMMNDLKSKTESQYPFLKNRLGRTRIVFVGYDKLPENSVRQVSHNTLALSSSSTLNGGETSFIQLSTKPWEMPDDLQEMFDRVDRSAKKSQAVFAKLSVEQLNFRPANGTHTPRWNTEHMMGRQLLFFSQIYHAADNSIPVMDKNPKQMPPDYVAAHPDWDGKEEARQIERVLDFCKRFAYLLEGQPLNQRARGSRWPTLRALLEQMERHWDEHTVNTQKKFELPGWPASE